ncbi:MAG TPA: site-specific integrase [Iamia sp.]|nr:site-specific integrase [Iamia sp.]
MTTRRRSSGEGTVYRDEATGRWVGQMDAGRTDTGKRRRVKVTGASRKEVIDKLRARRTAMEAGDQALATATLATLLDEWEAAVVSTMTPNNAEHARWALKHLRRGLGHHRLLDLRVTHVETFLRARAAGGLNRTSVGRLRAVLGRVLRWGQRRELVARNVAELAELPPAAPPKEGRSLTVDELRALLDAAKGTRLEAVWVVLGGVGLRPGEALGLTWSDVDLKAGIVHVRRGLKWPEGGAPHLGDLKTARSRRSIALPAPVVSAFKAHRARWLEARMALGATDWTHQDRDDGGLIFTTEAGTPIEATNLRRDLAAIATKAGVGHLRPYDLRHTAASLMAAAGLRLEQVADVLGHDGITMARHVYVHALAPTVDAAVAPLGEALGER